MSQRLCQGREVLDFNLKTEVMLDELFEMPCMLHAKILIPEINVAGSTGREKLIDV